MAVYAVANRKGGVGKTTTAVTLAHGMAMRFAEAGAGNVLLVDLDPQGNVATCLGIMQEQENTLAELLNDEATLRDCIIPTGRERLYLLPADDRLAEAKTQMISRSVTEAVTGWFQGKPTPASANRPDLILTERMSAARQAFDVIIIDCPPSMDVLTKGVYHFADVAIVPIRTDFLSAQGAARHIENILQAQDEGVDISIGLVVPTFLDSRRNLDRWVLDSIHSYYGKELVAHPIPRSVRLAESTSHGQTIFEYMPDSPPALAYMSVLTSMAQLQSRLSK